MINILVVEDEREILDNLCDLLRRKEYAADGASGVKEALAMLEDSRRNYDLALLDLYLQDGKGYDVARAAQERNIPVIFMTARDDEYSAAFCLENMGADYVPKNRTVELMSRVRNALEKSGKMTTKFQAGDLLVDTEKAVAYKNGQPLDLTNLQYRLLLYFMRRPDKFISREELIYKVWTMTGCFAEGVSDDAVRARIKDLRKAIEDDPQNPRHIQTVHGQGGYKFVP